jgi:hypothetical protein
MLSLMEHSKRGDVPNTTALMTHFIALSNLPIRANGSEWQGRSVPLNLLRGLESSPPSCRPLNRG